jgi:hypothetical protein
VKLTVLQLSQHQLLSQDRTGTGKVQGEGSRGKTEAEFASSVEFYDLVFFEVGSVTKSQQYGIHPISWETLTLTRLPPEIIPLFGIFRGRVGHKVTTVWYTPYFVGDPNANPFAP